MSTTHDLQAPARPVVQLVRTRRAAVVSPSLRPGGGLAPLSVADVRALQRLAGNSAVSALFVQRDDDPAGGGADQTSAGSDAQASEGDQAASPDALEAAFQPDDIVATMAGMGEGAADLAPDPGAAPDDGATAQAFFLQRDPPPGGGEPAPAKAASAGDLLSALAAVPEIKAALEALKKLALADWDQFLKGTTVAEKAATVTVGAAIVLGGVAGAASDPQARQKGFSMLNGAKIPIPGLSGLTITPQITGDKFTGGSVGLDMCKVPGVAKSPLCN